MKVSDLISRTVPQQSLRMAIRDPHATSQSLGDALRAYFAAAPKPKPLVVYTPEEYAALQLRRAKRKKKQICLLCGGIDCACVVTRHRRHFGGDEFKYTHREAKSQEEFEKCDRELWAKEVDDYARWYEAEWIRLIAESEEPYFSDF